MQESGDMLTSCACRAAPQKRARRAFFVVLGLLFFIAWAAGCQATDAILGPKSTPKADAENVRAEAAAVRKSADTIDAAVDSAEKVAPGLPEHAAIRGETDHLRDSAGRLDGTAKKVEKSGDELAAVYKQLADANSKAAQRERWVWVMFSIGGVLAMIAAIPVAKFVSPAWAGTVGVCGAAALVAGIVLPRLLAVADALVQFIIWGGAACAAVLAGVVVYQMIRKRDTLVKELVGTVEKVKAAAPDAWKAVESEVVRMQSDSTIATVAKAKAKGAA